MRLAVGILVALAMTLCSSYLLAQTQESVLAQRLALLQPRLSPEARDTYARTFITLSSDESLNDPELIAALVMRESSFRIDIAQGSAFGRLGEIGLMQIHPRGPARFLVKCDVHRAKCGLQAGVRWLVKVRDKVCPGSMWRWVSGYGRSRCPSEDTARSDVKTIRARDYYCRISDDCDSRWPIAEDITPQESASKHTMLPGPLSSL